MRFFRPFAPREGLLEEHSLGEWGVSSSADHAQDGERGIPSPSDASWAGEFFANSNEWLVCPSAWR